MNKKVVVESKARVFDDFFKVDEVWLRYEKRNGLMSDVVRRLNFERGDSVAAIIYCPIRSTVVLINQFKLPTLEKGPGWITEIVAGMVEAGESFEDAAKREVFEETGYNISTLDYISTFYVSPGGSSERIILFCARVKPEDKVGLGGGISAEGEDVETLEVALDDALGEITSGSIVDAKTIVALYWLRNEIKQYS